MFEMELLKNRKFFLLWFGQTLSAFGNPFTSIATAWIVYDLTGSKLALGGILLANSIPLVLFRLFAGTLVDRWDRRTTMLLTDIIRAVTLLAPVLLYAMGNLEIWHLYIVNIILGVSEAFFQPATFALVPHLVPSLQLVKANGFLNASIMFSFLIGPTLAGMLVGMIEAPYVLLIDAVTYAISALTIFYLPSNKPQERIKKQFMKDLQEGFSFYKEHRSLLWLLALAATSNTGMGIIFVLLLPISIELLNAGSEGYGFLQSAASVGMLVGSLFASVFVGFPRSKVMLIAHTIGGLFVLINSYSYHLWFSLILIVGYGVSVAVWNTFSGATYQELVPDRIRGRVQSVRLLIAQGTMPLGMAVGSLMAQWVGLRGIVFIVGGAIILSGIVAFMIPSIKGLDRLMEKKEKVTFEEPV